MDARLNLAIVLNSQSRNGINMENLLEDEYP